MIGIILDNPIICHIIINENEYLLFFYLISGYVRKYFDVKKRTFLCNSMRDFGCLYA